MFDIELILSILDCNEFSYNIYRPRESSLDAHYWITLELKRLLLIIDFLRLSSSLGTESKKKIWWNLDKSSKSVRQTLVSMP